MLPKLLWVSDTVALPTGYGQVTRNVLMRLKLAGFDVHNMGFQQVFSNTVPSNIPINYQTYLPIFPSGGGEHQEFYGNKGSVEHYAKHVNPDIIAFLCDSFMIRWLVEDKIYTNNLQKEMMSPAENLRIKMKKKLLFYFPFDSDEVYPGAEDVMRVMDYRVSMSRHGQRLLKRDTGLDSFYIPHGVDTSVYRKLPQEVIDAAKKENNLEGKFVVGCVARNQTRKMLTRLLDAFKVFSEDKEDVVLFMHCDPKDQQGNDLVEYKEKNKITNIIFGMKSLAQAPNETFVNLIYNIFDIHVIPTTGEGFGLPMIESMAVGIPNICTDYTTTRELLGNGRGLMAKWDDFVVGQLNTKRVLVNKDDLVRKMEMLYRSEKLRNKIATKAKKYVIEHYDWSKIMRMWVELLQYGDIYEKP